MVRKYIYIFTLLVVTTLSYALINSATALADGEKWTLTDKTTVKVTGGALGSTTVTLKPNSGDGRSDPSVWTETGSKSVFFTSGTDKICARINGLNDIDANRSKTGSIDLVDPGWCSDPIAPGGGGVRGPTGSTGLSTKATLTSTIATTPLKCGDAGFTGPCAEPFNPATTDCSTVADATARTRCESIKVCIVDNDKSADECTSGWDACMATYADADEGAKGAGVVNCANAIKKANFEEGKYVEPAGEETSNCKIEGIGWLLCPAMNFMGMITDGSYQLVEGMLVTPVSMFNSTSTEGQSTRAVWEIMRNIANSLFVIAFMVIIYSQLTSTGITNYGVKKLLPKLVIAAILVNLSFIVCALAIDLSNVIGAATKGLFDSLGGLIEIPDSDGMNIGNGGGGWLYIVGMVLSAGGAAAIIYAQIALLLPMLVGALAAIVTVVIVLTMRQALIILLVIISPLAFVALLLPNTEGWFKKWRSIFFVMLLMFPAVAAIFGASALAGKIVMNSSDGDILVQIVGAGITIIPLFITPVIMKAAGGVLNRFAGIVNNTDKGMFDRMRKRADGTGKNIEGRRAIRAMKNPKSAFGRKYTRTARREAIGRGIEGEANRSTSSYVADLAEGSPEFANRLAGGTRMGTNADPEAVQRAVAGAINIQAKLEADEVTAAKAVLQKLEFSTEQREKLERGEEAVDKNMKVYKGGSLQKAAISNAVAEQRMGDIEKIAQSSNLTDDAAKHLSQTIQSNYATTKAKSAHLVDNDNLQKLASGSNLTKNDLDNATASTMKGMSPELMSTQKGEFLKRAEAIKDDINSPAPTRVYSKDAKGNPDRSADIKAATNIKTTATKLMGTPELSSRLGTSEESYVLNIQR